MPAVLAFPSHHAWTVPARGWHADANYLSALSPPAGVRTHALFGDVARRAGGTLIVSGSHRLVHTCFRDPDQQTARAPRFLLSGGVDLPSMWRASPS